MNIKEIMKNEELMDALRDFFNNEPSEALAIQFGIQISWDFWENLDEQFVKRISGEAIFPLSDGTKWRATVKHATFYGGNDELVFEKIS